ncbi:MAG: hypothetical protein LUH10_03400, partial [Tannerellaceae bacterium]|nr:hypothetical protein [Tannerellaceae bacterium]
LNQYLFSAEGSFFDRLTLLPTFQSLLKSRYIEYLLFTVFLFLVLSLLQLIIRKNDWVTVATYVYSIGVIIPLSFGSIFFANHKHSISGLKQVWTDPPQMQGIYIIFCYGLTMSIPIIIHILFTSQIAIYYMSITGIIGLLLTKKWLDFIYTYYIHTLKYTHSETYRK